jgi:microcystin-dependent protein
MKLKHILAVGFAACLIVTTAAWAVSFSTNKGYFLPTVAGDPNLWGGYLNDTTAIIDNNMGGLATVNVSGSANVTATSTQAQNLVQKLTGTLTGSINYVLPAAGSFYIINNATAGGFTVTVLTSAGGSTGTLVPQGQSLHVWSDGTNVYPANGSSTTPSLPVGSGMEFWGTSAPPGWIFPFGQSLGRTTCPALFAVITTTYGTVDGSHFTAPDMRGRLAIGKDDMGGSASTRITAGVSGITGTTLGATGGDQRAQADPISSGLTGGVSASSSASSAVTDPGHAHGLIDATFSGVGATSGGTSSNTGTTSQTTTNTNTTGITVATSVTTSITNTMGVSVTTGLSGGAQNVQPGIIANYIINAGGPCT